PGVIMTLAGGALFGPVLGTFYNLTGATLGAALAFLLARYLAADWVERRTRGRARRLINGVEAEGWRFVAFVRLMPLFPFNLLNYLLGLTRIPFVQYLVATYLFMLPGAVAYTYLGYAGREAAAGGEDLVQKILLALGLLAVLAFLPRLVIRLRMGGSTTVPKLKERLEAGEDIRVLDVRTQADFESGTHGDILGAIHIPLEELAERLDEIATDSDRPLAILCLEDRRAIRAAKLLAGRGFSNARVVRKGATAWNDGGWPVFKASPSTEAGS
ncbi:MAG: VTT domain-containing protein, partial [Pseudomonadota bacterium]